MEARHHHGGERLRGKRAADVLGSPGATVHQISGRHYRVDKLELEPLLDVVDDLARDCRIAAGIKLLREESKQIAITPKVTVRFDQIAGERIADDLSGKVLELAIFAGTIRARNPLYSRLLGRDDDGADGLANGIDKVSEIFVTRSTTPLPAASASRRRALGVSPGLGSNGR